MFLTLPIQLRIERVATLLMQPQERAEMPPKRRVGNANKLLQMKWVISNYYQHFEIMHSIIGRESTYLINLL